MDRATALAHLVTEYAALAAVTGQATTDTADGYGGALDQALRQLDFTTAELATAVVEDADVVAYLRLAEYFALRRFANALALAVDIETDVATGTRKRSGLFEKVLKLVDLKKAELVDLGYLVSSDSSFQVGRMLLDFLEPAPTEFG